MYDSQKYLFGLLEQIRVDPCWRKNSKEWIVTKNAHPAIITEELWEKTQLLRQIRSPYHPRWDSHKTEYLLSGMLICSACGYPFQGWSAAKKNHRYFRYMDGGYKNKGICSKLVLNRDKLERFAIERVKEVMANPNHLERVEKYLDLMFKKEPQVERSERRDQKRQLDELKMKIQNIVEAIESRSNGVKLDTLMKRLEDLEAKENELLELLNAKKQNANSAQEVQMVKEVVCSFIQNFEKYFDTASLYDKKLILQKCIKTITIDRKTEMVRFHFHEVPAAIPQIGEMMKKNSVLSGLSSGCSGGAHFSLLSTMHYVLEMPLDVKSSN